jgi:hypothetical protein
MRKVKLFIAPSLDGYIAREDGGIDCGCSRMQMQTMATRSSTIQLIEF